MDEDEVFNETVGSIHFDLNDLIKNHCVHDHDKQGHDVANSKFNKSHKHKEAHDHNDHEDEENHHIQKFVWKNVYGSPLNMSDSKAKREANNNPEFGSMWKGRILM